MGAPAVIVHSLDHITAALRAAGEAGCDVLILSAPYAAASTGAGIFQAMVEQAQEEMPGRLHPDGPVVAALGCGSDGGHALAAIRIGIKAIVLSDRCPAYNRVADIAGQNSVQLLSPVVYEALDNREPLDLMEQPAPLVACRAFLQTGKVATEPVRRMTS